MTPAVLAHVDAEMRRLLEEADFAEARFGRAYGAGLRHVHETLVPVVTIAFESASLSSELSLSKRDRAGHARFALAIADAVAADLSDVEMRFGKVLSGIQVQGPGARAKVEAAIARGRVTVDAWWEGHLRLGPLRSPAVAQRPWTTFRPIATWIPWSAGAVAVASVATPASIFLLL